MAPAARAPFSSTSLRERSSLSTSTWTAASSGSANCVLLVIALLLFLATASADDEGFDGLEDGRDVGGNREGAVRRDRFAQQGVQRRGVAALDTVNGKRGSEDF